jgi:hypothetical protein
MAIDLQPAEKPGACWMGGFERAASRASYSKVLAAPTTNESSFFLRLHFGMGYIPLLSLNFN